MIQPGVYNIKLQRRADYGMLLEFRGSDRAPLDLTGWQVFAQVWDLRREEKLADFAVTYVDRAFGKVRLKLAYTDTSSLPAESAYDVLLINPSGEREYYLEGTVGVAESYTVAP
jgi:hypothetical protein